MLSSMLIAKGATGILGNAKNIATTLQPIGNAIKSIGLAAQTAPSVGAFISDLGAMVPTAAKFGLAAAAVTAAVVGIGVAVDNYNQKALSSNLEEHLETSNYQPRKCRTLLLEFLIRSTWPIMWKLP